MKPRSNEKPRTLTGKLIAFAAVGAYFAILLVCVLLYGGKMPVTAPNFIIYVHPVIYSVAWLVLTGILLAYGTISKRVVYGFAWLTACLYAICTAVAGGSTYLAFAMCALVAVMTYACGRALGGEPTPRRAATPLSSVGGKVIVTLTAAVTGAGVLYLLLSSYLAYTTTPSASTAVYVQMMESLRTGFSFDTTLEFGESVSHLAAHISPIFLVYLPFYALIPSPAVLTVLQVAAVYSAVIPLWLIARRKGLSPLLSALLCALLCLFPAVWGGTVGSFHEYALLLPLLLWLIWALEARRRVLVWVLAAAVLCVRETCALHLFALGAYWLISHRKASEVDGQPLTRERTTGLILMGVSAVYLVAALAVLTYAGRGTLITRFENVTGIYGTDYGTLIRELVFNPAIALYEMLTRAKLHFVLCLLLPLGLLPLFCQKKAGLVFLLPLIAIHLLSDFPYHYNLDYPYAFGISAFALYLCAEALATLTAKADTVRLARRLSVLALLCTLIIGGFRLASVWLPSFPTPPTPSRGRPRSRPSPPCSSTWRTVPR